MAKARGKVWTFAGGVHEKSEKERKDKKIMRVFDLRGIPFVEETIGSAYIPYMGSKRRLATKILNEIYKTVGDFQNFYDLFGGGGAMSVAAYDAGHTVYYNELNKGISALMKYITSGGKIDPKWVSREHFMENKDRDDWYGGYIKSVWSFGNGQRNYLFGKGIEELKRLGHEAVVNKDNDALEQARQILQLDIPPLEGETIKERRIAFTGYIRKMTKDENKAELQRLQQLERLQQLHAPRPFKSFRPINSFFIYPIFHSFIIALGYEGIRLDNF